MRFLVGLRDYVKLVNFSVFYPTRVVFESFPARPGDSFGWQLVIFTGMTEKFFAKGFCYDLQTLGKMAREASGFRGSARGLNVTTSCGWLARPNPISSRPFNIWSSNAMFSATRSGCHSGRMTTAVPIFIRVVRLPRSVASINGLGELSLPLAPK